MQSGHVGDYATLIEGATSNPADNFGNTASWGFGYTSINSQTMCGGVFTSGSLATVVSSITFYGRSGYITRSAKAVICDNSGNILENGVSDPLDITRTATWYTFTFATPPTINPDTPYWLMIIADGRKT